MARRTRSRAAAQRGLARTRTHSANSETAASRWSRSQYRRRLRLEALEDRRLLAGITVTTLADTVDFNDGVTSLREAIFAANTVPGPDTIEFAPALTANGPATILLTQGELKITDSLTIDGPGAGLLTIDASGNDPTPELNNGDGSRVFHINNGVRFDFDEVFLNGLSIVGGDIAGNGGGIVNEEWLVVQDCKFTANSSSTFGGAIYNTSVTSLDGCIVDGNWASLGGGVANFGSLSLVRSVVSNNKAIATDPLSNAAGGGIFSNGNLGITNSHIRDNMTNGSGGGVHAATAHVGVVIRNSTISGNSAGDEGGGLRLVNMVLTLQDSTISGNSAARGGGIHMRGGAATIDSTTITLNEAEVEGGGAWLGGELTPYNFQAVRHTIIAGNLSDGDAPDMRQQILRGSINFSYSLVGSSVGSLLAESVGGGPDANGNLIGGPVNGVIDPLLGPLTDNGGFELPDGSRIMTHALLAGSPAINAGDLNAKVGDWGVNEFDQRGEPFERIVGGRIDIGAFEYQTPTDLNLLVDTLVDESDGDYSRGDLSLREAIELANATRFAGVVDTIRFDPALWAAGPTTILLTQGELRITDSLTIEGPAAELLSIDASGSDPTPEINNGDGARAFNIGNGHYLHELDVSIGHLTITGGDVLGAGGAISAQKNLTLIDSKVVGNFAATGGGGIYHEIEGRSIDLTIIGSLIQDNSTNGRGGGLQSLGRVSVEDSLISGNTAGRAGGGISGANVLATRTVIDRNAAAGSGGGIQGRIVTVIGSTISTNIASQGGGGGIDAGSRVTVTDSLICGNSAGGAGGGIVVTGMVSVTKSTISGNTAGIYGGGIRASRNVTVTDSIISGNSAGAGGGINAHGAKIMVVNSSFTGNSATYGGGILGENVTILSSTLSDNSAVNEGGGILARSSVEVIGSVISDNSSIQDGGGIAAFGRVKVVGSTISGNTAVGRGGGIFTDRYSYIVDVWDSTISENSASQGGGVWAGFANFRTLSVNRSTVTGNSAEIGGGLFWTVGKLVLDHAIVAENWARIGPDFTGLIGVVVDARFSLIGDNRQSGLAEAPVGSPDANGNLIGGSTFATMIDPKLGPLANNGGPTLTHALLPNSPARNMGNPLAAAGENGVPVHDQRGAPFTRVFDGRIDMGAVEAIPVGVLPGDYNGNAVVDAADYSVWRDRLGASPHPSPLPAGEGVIGDGNGDGKVDGLDFEVWKANFGVTSGEQGARSGGHGVEQSTAEEFTSGSAGQVRLEVFVPQTAQGVERRVGRRSPEVVAVQRERLLEAWWATRDQIEDRAESDSGVEVHKPVGVEAVDFAVLELGALRLGLGG